MDSGGGVRMKWFDWDNKQYWCSGGCYGIRDMPGFCVYCGKKLILRKFMKCSCGKEMMHYEVGRLKDVFCGNCGKSYGERLKEIGVEMNASPKLKR